MNLGAEIMSRRCVKAREIKEQREGSREASPTMHSSDEKASVAEIKTKTVCGMAGAWGFKGNWKRKVGAIYRT